MGPGSLALQSARVLSSRFRVGDGKLEVRVRGKQWTWEGRESQVKTLADGFLLLFTIAIRANKMHMMQ